MNKMKEQDFSKNLDMATWKAIFGYMKPYKTLVARLVLAMLFVGGADALYPQFNRIVIDQFIIPMKTEGMWVYGALYGGMVVIQALAIWVFIATAGRLEMNLAYDIRKAGFQQLTTESEHGKAGKGQSECDRGRRSRLI